MKFKHHLDSRVIRETTIKIDVIGCGGTGSQVLSGLACMNHAMKEISERSLEVRAYDADTVSKTNIGRQAFFPCDVGKNKAMTLIDRINYSYGTDWEAVPAFKTSADTFSSHIVITCVDSAKARADISKAFSRKNRHHIHKSIYWLDTGNKSHSGQVCLGYLRENGYSRRTVNPVELPFVTELFPELLTGHVESDDLPSCSMEEALRNQSLYINRVIANHALALLWQLLNEGELDHCGLFVNLKNGRANPIGIDPKQWESMGMNNALSLVQEPELVE